MFIPSLFTYSICHGVWAEPFSGSGYGRKRPCLPCLRRMITMYMYICALLRFLYDTFCIMRFVQVALLSGQPVFIFCLKGSCGAFHINRENSTACRFDRRQYTGCHFRLSSVHLVSLNKRRRIYETQKIIITGNHPVYEPGSVQRMRQQKCRTTC